MYKVGVFSGKFTPPHRGHINAIIQAGTKCEKLYVVISHNAKLEEQLYAGTKVKPITLKEKARWLSVELSEFDHIKVIMLDEADIPVYPYGWELWSKKLNEVVGEKFDVIFGGEPQYADEGYTKYFPDVKYEIYDNTRSKYPISATDIRNNPYKYWDYILGVARPHFTKKVLITGSESCGKTTLTKMLAKIFFTSWAREEGRYYSTKYFGGNENVFELNDFYNICWEQRQIEEHALRTANKIAFFDTDAVVTQFYCEMYLGEKNPAIETMVDKNRYDLLLMMTPDVKWVADGFRWNNDDKIRMDLHNKLKQMYIDRGFGYKIIEIGGNYNERLNRAIEISNQLIN
jgi:HTH-type transcriptional repressor of NAD biosynthesis genes